MTDIWYRIVYWVEDNLQIVLSILLVVVFGVVMFFVTGEKEEEYRFVEGVKKDTLEEVEAVKGVTEEIDEVFSLLSERRVGVHEEFPAYEVDLFLKQPFIKENDLKDILKTYIEIYKWKENHRLSGLKITLYDRKLVYDEGLEPRATIYYYKKLTKEKMLTEEEGGERLYGDDVMGDNFRDTVDEGKMPQYVDYEMRINNFEELNQDKNKVPLTDQEFAFYLKMDLYQTLLGGSKYGGAKLYLQWDLGKDVYKDGVVAIEREFNDFYKRHTDIGGQTNYYDNQILLKQKLAIEKPQFLLFALTNKLYEDPLDAQRELIKEDSDTFKRVLEDYVNEQVEEQFIDSEEDTEYKKEDVEEIEEDETEENEYIEF